MNWKIAGIAFMFVIFLGITALASGWLAAIGAGVGGMPASSWSLEPLAYIGYGIVGGGIMFCVFSMGLAEFSRNAPLSMALSMAIVIMLALPGGCAGYKFLNPRGEIKREESADLDRIFETERRKLYEMIRKDPGIVVREEWFKPYGESGKMSAYISSLSDPEIEYDTSVIMDLYAKNEQMRLVLVTHPSFDLHILEQRFERNMELLEGYYIRTGGDELSAILSNPHARTEWFERVMASGALMDQRSVEYPSLRGLVEETLRKRAEEDGAGDEAR